jgi:hypothetical protein
MSLAPGVPSTSQLIDAPSTRLVPSFLESKSANMSLCRQWYFRRPTHYVDALKQGFRQQQQYVSIRTNGNFLNSSSSLTFNLQGALAVVLKKLLRAVDVPTKSLPLESMRARSAVLRFGM